MAGFVVVVGLGGVGSHAAHLLLRSGVGRLRLIDFDQARTQARTRPHWLYLAESQCCEVHSGKDIDRAGRLGT
jgi:malate/lactate dehydrogenase